jgi:hypothetical protein
MGLRDAAKQVTGIGNPAAGLAAEADIVKQLIEAQKTTPDALGQFFDRQKGRTTQNLLGEMQAVNTGNPMQDEDIRQTMLKDRGAGFFDMGKINPAMQTFKTEGQADYLKDVTVRDKLLSESHKKIDKEQLFKIGQHPPGTSKHEKALAESIDSNIQNNVTAPGVTALATQSLNNKDIQFAPITNTNGEVVGNTITNAVGDVANSKSWNTNAYRAAEKVAVKNMARDNPYIRDHSVFKAKFKNMVENHPEYGQKFKLGMADEAGMTIDTQTLEGFTTKISEGVNNPDPVQGRKDVVSNLNSMLSYMSRNRLKGEDLANYDDLIMRTLERDPLDSTTIFKAAGIADPENVNVISTSAQAKAKKYVRDHYRKAHPELPDRILTKAYDRIINSGSDNVSVAVGIGKTNAESLAKMRVSEAKFFHDTWEKNVKDLRVIQSDQGLVNTLNKKLEAQFKENFKDQQFSSRDSKRLKKQVKEAVGKLQTHIGKGLTGDAKDAFQLTAQRLVLNMGTWDENTKFFGFNVPEWMGGGADFGLLSGAPMSSENTLRVMELFHANILDPTTVRAAKKGEVRIKKGAELLLERVNEKIKEQKSKNTANLSASKNGIKLNDLSPLGILEKVIPTP